MADPMAERAVAFSPAPCAALDAILALDEHSLPSTNGLPLPDGRVQQEPLDYARGAIRFHLREQRDRFSVDGDMFVYYVAQDDKGRPKVATVAPDVLVVAGVPDRPDRNSYVLWREPEAELRFVLEIASKSTRARDHGAKRAIYASLGVREYFLYDPPGRRRPGRILGLRLHDGRYVERPSELLPNGASGVRSETLALVAYVDDGGDLRWLDPATGQDLDDPTTSREKAGQRDRAVRERDEANRERDQAIRERDLAQARIDELEARLHD